MSIQQVELRRVAVPLREPFRAAHSTEDVRDVLLVRVLSAEGDGWGECAALRDSAYAGEDVEAAHRAVRDVLVPLVLAARPLGAAGTPMARAAVDMALLALHLALTGTSLAAHLGATRARVPAGVAVGLLPSIDDALAAVDRFVSEGYQRVKLKISPGDELDLVRAVRSAHPALPLQVDANEAYTRDDLAVLRALDAAELLLIEQPFARDDLEGHAWLRGRIGTPVCLDESLASTTAAVAAFDRGACDVACIKPGRLGGIAEAAALLETCRERGIDAWIGGMLETGIGRAANIALAALPGATLVGDIAASSRYFARDLIDPPIVLDGGAVAVPSGSGLGVRVDRDAIDAATTTLESFTI